MNEEVDKVSFLSRFRFRSNEVSAPEVGPLQSPPAGQGGMRRYERDPSGEDDDDGEDFYQSPLSSGYTNFTFVPQTVQFRPARDEDIERMVSSGASENEIERELVARYKQAPTQENLEAVYAHFTPNLEGYIARYKAQRVPEPAVRGKVYNAFHDALQKFDPERSGGMQFHSYLYSQYLNQGEVPKFVNAHKGFGNVARSRLSKLDQVRMIQEQTELDLGREVTSRELAEATGLSLKHIAFIQSELRNEHMSSKDVRRDFNVSENAQMQTAIDRALDSLRGRDRKIAERLMSEDVVSQRVKAGQVAKEFGVTDSTVTKIKKQLKDQVSRERELLRRATGV